MAALGTFRAVGALLRSNGSVHIRGYAKKAVVKGKGKGLVKEVQKGPEVCKDPYILATNAMGLNIYKSGSDVQLKDDSHYPEWLFQLNLGPPKPLEELSPDTPQYWKRLRKLHMWRNNRLAKVKKF
ncbi:39S ribosomal protein L54, mitochondrial [Rana temporaria]|uniref:39S ribosomal protein L54, mitochondrial n=1 Tax=Rana temporaria TaxID=8407 RepID=UPI001AAD4DFC|nr:39S ribosomal protein L54, mitochondrial [Rana temporaria]